MSSKIKEIAPVLVVLGLFAFTFPLCAQDSVDQLESKYVEIERKGIIKLNAQLKSELVKVRDLAMSQKDLNLANKADSKIKELEKKIIKM